MIVLSPAVVLTGGARWSRPACPATAIHSDCFNTEVEVAGLEATLGMYEIQNHRIEVVGGVGWMVGASDLKNVAELGCV